MILRVGVGALLPAEGSDDVDEPPVVLDTGMSQGSVNLSSEEWDCDINGVVLKKSNGQVLGFKVKRLSGNVEKDILALFDGGKVGLLRLSAGEVEGVVLLTAEGDVHGGNFKNPCVLICFRSGKEREKTKLRKQRKVKKKQRTTKKGKEARKVRKKET